MKKPIDILVNHCGMTRFVGETDEQLRVRALITLKHGDSYSTRLRSQRLLFLLAKLRVAREHCRNYLPVGLDLK